MKVYSTIIALILLCAFQGNAQKGFEVGGWIGPAHYFGDINPNYNLKRLGFGAGFIGRYNFNTRVSVRISGNYARVSGYDSDSENQFQLARNLSFRSDILEGLVQMEFNFLPYIHGSGDSYYTPYLFGGLGYTYFNSKAELNNEWIDLQPLGTEGQPIGGEYNKGTIGLVFGAGFKIDISHVWSLNFELSGRALLTDYLDDVSTTYPNPVEIQALRGDLAAMLSDRSGEVVAEPIGEQGRQRGTRSTNDGYAFLSIGLVYYIGELQCPTISRPHKF